MDNNTKGSLWKVESDDSPIKSLVVYGGAVLGAYYLAKLLRSDLQRTQARQEQEQETQTAATTSSSAASKATRLHAALSDWGNTDEQTVYSILWTEVASVEHLNEIYASYFKLFKTNLEQDLYNKLDSWTEPWKPDWNKVKARLTYLKCRSRKIDPKTKQLTKLCKPMPPSPAMP
jgi:hypothetical protein